MVAGKRRANHCNGTLRIDGAAGRRFISKELTVFDPQLTIAGNRAAKRNRGQIAVLYETALSKEGGRHFSKQRSSLDIDACDLIFDKRAIVESCIAVKKLDCTAITVR